MFGIFEIESFEKFDHLGIHSFFRSDCMVTMYEDLDKQWKILTETCVKAKSIRGYKTKNFKMTANKFQLGVAKPELLEDWDPRYVKVFSRYIFMYSSCQFPLQTCRDDSGTGTR